MIGEGAKPTALLPLAARFRIHGLSIGVRSDEPAVIEALARSYGAFAVDASNDAPGTAWIDIERPYRPHLVPPTRPVDQGRLDAALILGALDRFVMSVLDGLGAEDIIGTHAGVVVIDGRAVLLAGPSGRGKSTLTLALVRDGAGWLTDELALIAADGRTVMPYPRAMHVSPATVELLPELAFLHDRPRQDLGAGSEWSVTVDDLRRAFDAGVAGPTPLGLIVLLDERGPAAEEPTITSSSAAEATFALLRGTPAAANDFGSTMRRLGEIASSVPVVRLRATDPGRSAAALRRYVAGLAAHEASPPVAAASEPPAEVDARSVARIGLLESHRSNRRTAWIEAVGRSMEPTIAAGSGLLVAFGRQPERVGDVIVFQRGDGAVAHRLVHRRRTPEGVLLVARGDGEAYLDPAIAQDDVLGVVRHVSGPDGRMTRLPRASRRAAAVAHVSWWSGRAAGSGTRLLRRSPLSPSVRRAGLRGLLVLSRVPTRVVAAALPRPVRGSTQEGGETHGVREPRDHRHVHGG